MEIERIEYIRKNGRKKGRKKGVMWCGIDPESSDSVILGFSLCNSLDKFDWIDGKHTPGFGLKLAKLRGEKWVDHTDYFVQASFTEPMLYDDESKLLKILNPNSRLVVEIPPSIIDRLRTFIKRCKKYYKDKDFPLWVDKIDNNDPYPEEELEAVDLCELFDIEGD